jgi:hypothetical protein
MTSDSKTPTRATWRDPLSVGFEAHRRLLLLRLRLRLRGNAAKRVRHGLIAARRSRSATDSTASATSGGSSTSNS